MGVSMHPNNHLGVSLMAMAHAAASAPHEVVAGGRIQFVNSCVQIPDKPGLGVELDYDQLARGRERYEKLDYRKRDDEARTRKHVDPNWKRVLPRW